MMLTNISDDGVKQEATVVVQKVGNLQIIIEALDFASRTHRANLEALLKEEMKLLFEPEAKRSNEQRRNRRR